ncbi:hypothetical protein KSF_071690 [Reticulibacter mediterranei]|uniref:Uncharacterized protein n=1 Tax=Reticulibacter mediterranei TaxID=2778369 RepID=A0A8J3IM70_9CHLR|nr:hypothetical protein [Reticulibacter mediterranei]GHO97121.1 hypothetical protein KSF_071690 [Reticulibacter mediterranei]
MAKFAFGEEKLTIIDAKGYQIDLSMQEAVSLLYWLSDQKAALFRLSRHESEPEKQPEKHFQQLEAFQVEYKIHPLLEDDNAFAQG